MKISLTGILTKKGDDSCLPSFSSNGTTYLQIPIFFHKIAFFDKSKLALFDHEHVVYVVRILKGHEFAMSNSSKCKDNLNFHADYVDLLRKINKNFRMMMKSTFTVRNTIYKNIEKKTRAPIKTSCYYYENYFFLFKDRP